MIGKRMLAALEYSLWALASGALLLFLADGHMRTLRAQQAVAEFRAGQAEEDATLNSPAPDKTDWSAGRRAVFDPGAARRKAEALLHIPALELVAPVRDGTDERTLNSFVGRVDDAADFGEGGNLVLAGHRDSYFRRLGDLAEGDLIEVRTLRRTWRYVVGATWIVEPEDIEVMQDTARPSLTLITCYPFYFVGPAPRRYIVRAHLVERGPAPGTLSKPQQRN